MISKLSSQLATPHGMMEPSLYGDRKEPGSHAAIAEVLRIAVQGAVKCGRLDVEEGLRSRLLERI